MNKMKKLMRKLYAEEANSARASLADDFKKTFRGVMALIVISCVPTPWVVAVSTAFGVSLPSFLFAVSPGITATLVVFALIVRVVQFALECNPKPKQKKRFARP